MIVWVLDPLKAGFQWSFGDKRAGETLRRWCETSPFVAPLISVGALLNGDTQTAKYVIGECGGALAETAKATPLLGHGIGAWYYAAGHKAEGDRCELMASRTSAVIVAGALGSLGGPCVAEMAAVSTGEFFDIAQQVVTEKPCGPLGRFMERQQNGENTAGEVFDMAIGAYGDIQLGRAGAGIVENIKRNQMKRKEFFVTPDGEPVEAAPGTWANYREAEEIAKLNANDQKIVVVTIGIATDGTKTYGVNSWTRNLRGTPNVEFEGAEWDEAARRKVNSPPIYRHSCGETQVISNLGPGKVLAQMITVKLEPGQANVFTMTRCKTCAKHNMGVVPSDQLGLSKKHPDKRTNRTIPARTPLMPWKTLCTGITLGSGVNPNKKNVLVRKLILVVAGKRDVSIMDSSEVNNLEQKTFTIKEACQHRLRIEFHIQREIVTGLKYIHKVSQAGVEVGKEVYMLGSREPSQEIQCFSTPMEPSSLPSGAYKVESVITDNDGHELLYWHWVLELKKYFG